MTQQVVNIGSAPNDGTGDPIRTAFDKTNQNTTELYGGTPLTIASVSADYAFLLVDANKAKLHPTADSTARTWTIPANASIPYPVGTSLIGYVQNGAGNITLAITTDTMRLAGAGTTGSRTITANGMFVATKLASTEWLVFGTGIT